MQSANHKIEKELSQLKNSNTGLNVSLAKSELLFSRKHKAEFDTERKGIEIERENIKIEKEKLKRMHIYKCRKTVSNKYIVWLSVAGLIIFSLIIFLLISQKKDRKRILGKDTEIEGLKNEKDKLSKRLNELAYEVNKLKEKEKYGCTSQVVDKINTYQIKRDQTTLSRDRKRKKSSRN